MGEGEKKKYRENKYNKKEKGYRGENNTEDKDKRKGGAAALSYPSRKKNGCSRGRDGV